MCFPLEWCVVDWNLCTIDLREKINHPFYYPENDGQAQTIEDRKSLIDIIYSACLSGEIQAYGSAGVDDEFKDPLTPTEFNQREVYEVNGKFPPWMHLDNVVGQPIQSAWSSAQSIVALLDPQQE